MIEMTEYKKRRQAVSKAIGKDSILIIPAACEILRNGDAHYPFRQNSDFYYLTGFDEPEAVMIIAPNRDDGEFILFNRVRDRAREIWDGPRAGQEGAIKHFHADQAFAFDQFELMLPDLLTNRESIYYPFGMNKKFDRLIMRAINNVRAKIRAGIASPSALHDSAPILHEMRLFKSEAEIKTIQKAVDITTQAHIRAMQICKPGMYEYELEAEILQAFVKEGARYPAYTSIIGAGKNSCVLHYISNTKKINDGEMVLIDAGCEYQNYASDITRTFPANGRFTAEQRAIYDIVLASQVAAIDCIKPGVAWTKPQEIIVKIITQGLIDLGLLKGSLDQLIEDEAYFPFYMHRSGHWLGLDVHDAGRYRVGKNWRPMQAGMVFTVEPGIYISSDLPVDSRWHNIGVRIEDDVLVTDKGVDVLSKKIPKQIAEIESLWRSDDKTI